MEYINVAAWHWPQFAYLCLLTVGVGMVFAKHGTPRTGNVDAFSSVVASALIVTILYYGRFFG